jgi:hypothetical protein
MMMTSKRLENREENNKLTSWSKDKYLPPILKTVVFIAGERGSGSQEFA